MVGMTSWHMLVGRAKIKPGQVVLIMGGGSGVGMVGIQIAKLYIAQSLRLQATRTRWISAWSLEPIIPSTTEKPIGAENAK